MELTDIMALVKAGYTKDEIAQMESPIHNTEPAQAEPVSTAQVTEPAPAQVNEPATPTSATEHEKTEPAQPTLSDILQGIAKLTSAVQANAIANSVMPQGISNPVSAEDIVAQIIRPTYPERGK